MKSGVHIHSVSVDSKSRITRIWKAVNAVYIEAVKLDCELYHIHDPELLRIVPKLLKNGKKVIYDAHEDVPKQILGKFWIPRIFRKLVSNIFESYENKMAAKVSFVITATPFIWERFVQVNSNCIDINNFPILPENIEEFSDESEKKDFCYVGGIDENRGITKLVEAINLTEASLLLGGEFTPESYGPFLSNLPGWKQVEYLGFLNRKEVRTVMRKSIAGLVTLRPLINYLDSLPVKMFEYMSMGLPVIASDFPLWKTIIEDNKIGLCVDPLNIEEIANAINWISDNKDEAKKMGEKGKALVYSTYNWPIEEEKLFKVYTEVLAK